MAECNSSSFIPQFSVAHFDSNSLRPTISSRPIHSPSTKRPRLPIRRRPWTCQGEYSNASSNPDIKLYNVTVHDPKKNVTHRSKVPGDQYVWWGLREAGVNVPSSCRHGCCSTCAVRIHKGEVKQKEALGLLKEMRQRGYALLCVSYPKSDIECTLQDEDEVYVQQFGDSFEKGGVEWGGFVPEDE